jgi:membrane dipeptidase
LNKGEAMLGWPEYQAGKIAIIFSTLFASPKRYESDPGFTQAYATVTEARSRYRSQLEAYKHLLDRHPSKFFLITGQKQLEKTVVLWKMKMADPNNPDPPVGLVLLMEGAEGILSLEEIDLWWENGLRIIGPAWAGNQYCGGTQEPGPLSKAGKMLLSRMDEIGFTLDISHMDRKSVMEAMDVFQGPIIASHSNAGRLLQTTSNRFLDDEIISLLIERDGVIGVIPYNHYLVWSWNYPEDKHAVKLETLVNHIDHICQLAGDSLHVGIGSDFDGGLGMQSTPSEINSVADLNKLVPLLTSRGYNDQEIDNVLFRNWYTQLLRSLPE